MRRLIGVVVVLGACSSDAVDRSEVGVEVETAIEVEVEVEAEVAIEVEVEVEVELPDELDARTYCEATVDLFCPYYVRCGRMAVPDVETCRAVFLESCNARYEPAYAALADRGELVLSRAGITRCAAHLETVACEQQIFDLDGGCDEVWRGQVAAGGACGLGLESFVCDADAICVIGLDFCGGCKPLVTAGAACDFEHRCPGDGDCVDGACRPRVAVGAACDEASSCLLGASCIDGACAAPTVVAVGERCDQVKRCPYKSACVSGTCREAAMLGEACGLGGCASGACVGGLCVALLEPGAACTGSATCRSGRCSEGRCSALTSECLSAP